MALTDLQQAFTIEYVQCWNKTEAVIKAGYKVGNRQRASEIGYQLLQKTPVLQEIQRQMSQMQMSANESLYRLGQMARANIADFLTDEGHLDLQRVKEKGFLVKSLTPTKYGTKIELHDSQSALVHIGRHHKLFTDRIELSGWQKEILDLLQRGEVTPKDIEDELGPDIAQEFFESAGLHFAGVGTTQEESATK